MGDLNPTIIAANLDSAQLEKSIDELVKSVDVGMDKVVKKFDEKITAIENRFGQMGGNISSKLNAALSPSDVSFDSLQKAMDKLQGIESKGVSNSVKGGGAKDMASQLSEVEAELEPIKSKTKDWFELIERIKDTIYHIKQHKADIAIYEFNEKNDPERNDKADKLVYEDSKRRIASLKQELSELWAKRSVIPAPTKEELQRYDELKSKLSSLKAQMEKLENPKTVGDLEDYIAAQEQLRKSMGLESEELKRQNELLKEKKDYLKENTMSEEEILRAEEKKEAETERRQQRELKNQQEIYKERLKQANNIPTNNIDQMEKKLDKLVSVQAEMRSSGLFKKSEIDAVGKSIDNLRVKIERVKAARPKSLKEVLGMDESSVDAISKKMSALRNVSINTQNTAQVRKLSDEYQRLSRLQAELLGKSVALRHSNNYLAQSFGYIRNRVVYALTLGAVTSFTKQVYEIRAQYELLERSLGVLVNSFERGSQIFQELNQMALKSPFTLIELGTAAKQLTAYNFAADEVVGTTRRLADISAALGVPMERLTYNLGQIRAQTVLTSRDARDFANAGLPMVKALADYYSELRGEVVSTGDVFDMMKKKAVSYNDVMAVLNQMTDEGGKFFDFQAKQAETLKVQLANMSLAWNNMLNEIGKANQDLMTAPFDALKFMFKNWKEISHVVKEVVVAYGLFKGYQIAMNTLMGVTNRTLKANILANKEKLAVDLERKSLLTKLTATERKTIATRNQITAADYKAALASKNLTKQQAYMLVAFNKSDTELSKAVVKLGLLSNAEAKAATNASALGVMFNNVVISIKSLGRALKAMAINPFTWVTVGISMFIEFIHTLSETTQAIGEFNKAVAESAKEGRESIESMLKDYAEVYSNNIERWKNNPTDTNDEDIKIWERIKEEIKNSSAASDVFLKRLESIKTLGGKISEGFNLINKIHDANGALEQIDSTAIDINQDWAKWWNLWAGTDGLVNNIKDYVKVLEQAKKTYGSFEQATSKDKYYLWRDKEKGYGETFEDDLSDTTESMIKAFENVGIKGGEKMREAFARSVQQIAKDGNLSTTERIQLELKAEESFIKERAKMFDEEYAFEKKKGNNRRAENVKLEKEAWLQQFGVNKSVEKEFFDWLRNSHASELGRMFGNMTKKEVEELNWSEKRWQKWATDNAKSFAEQNDIAFSKLKDLVNDANTWKIFIETVLGNKEQSQYDILTEADKNAKEAKERSERLNQFIKKQNKEGKSTAEETLNAIEEEKKAQEDLNEALAKGGQLKEATKKSGGKKDPFGDALQKEVEIITNINKKFKEYRKEGVSAQESISLATQEYSRTLASTNSTLQRYGVKNTKTGADFAKMDLRDMRSYLQNLLGFAKAANNTKGIEALEKAIANLNEEIVKFDMKKVTDSLNSELGKLKEEYEFGIELDANPELGDMFGDVLGLDKEKMNELPRTFADLAKKLQEAIEKSFEENKIDKVFDLTEMLDKGKFEKWVEDNGNMMEDKFVAALNAIREYANKVRIDEAKKTTNEWSKLIEKYGDIQAKLLKIYKESVAEQLELVKQFGNEVDKTKAFDLVRRINVSKSPEHIARLQQELAELVAKVSEGNESAIELSAAITNEQGARTSRAYWEDFKNSEMYSMLFDDMAHNSTKAIGMILDKLEELKEKVKEDPASMKSLMQQIKEAEKELANRNPFRSISKGFSQMIEGFKGLRKTKKEIKELTNELSEDEKKLKEAQDETANAAKQLGGARGWKEKTEAAEKYDSALKKEKEIREDINKKQERQNSLQQTAVKFSNMIREGWSNVKQGAANYQSQLQSISSALGDVANMFSLFGDDDTAEAINDINKGFQVMIGVIGAVIAIMLILEATAGPIILALSAAMALFIGLASLFSGSHNRKINKAIKESEANVRKLENAYKDLEQAIKDAYGAEEYGLKQAEIANKKAQLAELQRQLQLEKSRSGKHYDQEKIDDLTGQVKDLQNEIADMTKEIVTDMLGISSVGEAAESLVDSMIEAFREGEDYMKSYSESFDDMVNNMIVKAIASRVIGDRLQEIFDNVDAMTSAKGASAKAELEKLTNRQNALDESIANAEKAYADMKGKAYISDENKAKTLAILEQLKKERERVAQQIIEATQAYADSTRLTAAEVGYVQQEGERMKNEVREEFESLMEAFGIKFGDRADSDKLSNLQQGIQSVTEDTANAIEAYLNGVSQQVYAQTQLLTEIRDTITSFDLDVQMGIHSQMLLQLQQNYAVQMAIQSIMQGWTTPSGMAVRVEMV